MQWLIDIITEVVLARFSGIIMAWSGTLATIPDGWVLCDGNNGTPNLDRQFIMGASVVEAPGGTGGGKIHTHTFTSNTHDHDITLEMTADGATDGNKLAGTENGPISTEDSVTTGTTADGEHLPPFYVLAYIMKT